ncbi:MAG: hypothetical protein NTW26_00075 [bacterium]|nr:hypothetical protein [bacterium]
MTLFTCLRAVAHPSGVTTIAISDEVLVTGVKRLGLNVGARSQYGAGQIIKNLIHNPGFEAGVFGSVVHAEAGSTGQRIVQYCWDPAWNNETFSIGWPVDFWDGGEYEFVSGPAQGRSGLIADFTHEGGRNVFYLDTDGPAPNQYDVMFVRRNWSGSFPSTAWSFPDTSTTRPGSPGLQSLRLVYPGPIGMPSYAFYMDSGWRDGDRTSGKLFLVKGNWRLEFWAKGNREGAQIRARFARDGEYNFVDQTIALTTDWRRYAFDVSLPSDADRPGPYTPEENHPILSFTLFLLNSGDEVWVDDIALQCADHTNPTVFTDTFIDRLRELRPGVLRMMGAQFGATLDVQLAEPWARKTEDFQHSSRIPGRYSYSLPEFLELCREVEADPWYSIPVTYSPSDLLNLVEYLAAPADGTHPYAEKRAVLGQSLPWTTVFPSIHLEFGNEAWGGGCGIDPFAGESLMGGTRLGRIASGRFAIMRSSPHYDSGVLDLIIGGFTNVPSVQGEIERSSAAHDTIALGPYLFDLDHHANDEEVFCPVLAQPLDDITAGRIRQGYNQISAIGQGTGMATYEFNFHHVYGDCPLDIRNDLVTSQAGALALPLEMLLILREFGVKTQCLFSAHGYSFRMTNGEYVRLWGMLRDLEVTGRKRPSWLGVELVNRAIEGDLVRTTQGGDNPSWMQQSINGVSRPITVNHVQSFAFRNGSDYSAVLFNLSLSDALDVEIGVPFSYAVSPLLYRIAPASLHDDNEDAENVTIESQTFPEGSGTFLLTLPPHSLSAVIWKEPPSPPPAASPTPSPASPPPPTASPSVTSDRTPSATPFSSPSRPPAVASPSPTPTCGPTVPPEQTVVVSGDYNGDGVSDIAVFRPASGQWRIKGITQGYFGTLGDNAAPGDFNGDGRAEFAIFRPATGLWAVNAFTRFYFGRAGDIPVPGDYNGDGFADYGIYRAAASLWRVRGLTLIYLGTSGDWPAPGDYTGEETSGVALYRPATGLWLIRGLTRTYFGRVNDWPVGGDYTGDGTWEIGVWRPCTGLWALKALTRVFFGACFDWPRPADYDGNGFDDIGIFRGSAGLWSIRSVTAVYYGTADDIPATR